MFPSLALRAMVFDSRFYQTGLTTEQAQQTSAASIFDCQAGCSTALLSHAMVLTAQESRPTRQSKFDATLVSSMNLRQNALLS
jgi:hypothetical protein